MSANHVHSGSQSVLDLGVAVLLRKTSLSDQIDVSHYLENSIDQLLSSKVVADRQQYYQLLSFYLQQCQAIDYPKLLQSVERVNILIETAQPSDYDILPVFLHYLASSNDKHPELKAIWTKNMSKIIQTCVRVYNKNRESDEVATFILDIVHALLISDNDTLALPHSNQLQELCSHNMFPSSYIMDAETMTTLSQRRRVDLSASVYTLLMSHVNPEKYSEVLKSLIGIYYGVLVQLDYPKMSINKNITSSIWSASSGSKKKAGEGQGMQKVKYYREIFARATKVLVLMLETGHASHRPFFPLDLYLPLLPALLSYKESTVSLQDRMSYMENDEGISRVDAMFVFSDLQADILRVLQGILTLSTAPSSMPLLQSASQLLPYLFNYLYSNSTFHPESRALTSFSGNLSTLRGVLAVLSQWIRTFPTSVLKTLTEYEKIYAHRHICVELWIYTNASIVLTRDPTRTLLATASPASKTSTRTDISPLDADLMFAATHEAMVAYLTSLAPYMSSQVRQQISSHMFTVLQYVGNLLESSNVHDALWIHRHRVLTEYAPRILELSYLDLTLYPQPSVPTSNLLLLQDILLRLKGSKLAAGRWAAIWGGIEVGISGLLFPSQVVLPGAGKVEDIAARLFQQQQVEESSGVSSTQGKRGHNDAVVSEPDLQEKKKIRLEEIVSMSSSRPAETTIDTPSSESLPPALSSGPNAQRKEPKEAAEVSTRPNLPPPSALPSKAATASKKVVSKEDDDDDDLPDLNLDDD